MKKTIIFLIYFLFISTIFVFGYLSFIGFETDKFNSVLENKIKLNVPNTKINLNKIKIKMNIKNLSFFVTTINPNIDYHDNKIDLKRVDAYMNLKSLLLGNPKIDEINIVSNEIEVKEIKDIVKYQKPSNVKKFFLNNVTKGIITFKLDLDLENNEVTDYEINGIAKNFYASSPKLNFKKSSFIYSIKKNSGEIDNVRSNINGFQINSGNIKFDNSKSLTINGNLDSDFILSKNDINHFFKKKIQKNIENFKLDGTMNNIFKVNFDKTLKIIDYQIDSSGDIQKSDIKFKDSQINFFLKKKINNLNLEKAEFQINYSKSKKNSIQLSGLYKTNDNILQKFNFKNLFDDNLNQLSIDLDFDNEIILPSINYNSNNKIVNISTILEVSKNNIYLKKLNFKEGKSKIDISNLYLKKGKLLKFDHIFVKTYADGKFNNDFKINFDKIINIKGLKYDASNLSKLIEQNNDSNFLKNVSKEISLDIKEILTSDTDIMSNFSLIGKIDNGKFSKITSKGEFKEGKYLDISLKVDKASKKKILEIYSDLPKPLLSNYKFFDGLSGGQILIYSSYDSQESNTNLTIENFKVKDAPGLVKLLSLADFGGMVDALSGDGLSFEKLEMTMDKNDKLLNLTELYAIGPSISILMEGYVDSKTGLVSLRGTMVPAKTLNKFLSKLPLVGDILIPKEIGEGLFGISFKMKGTPGKIKTTVNPIKTLTPRFIQKALKKSN